MPCIWRQIRDIAQSIMRSRDCAKLPKLRFFYWVFVGRRAWIMSLLIKLLYTLVDYRYVPCHYRYILFQSGICPYNESTRFLPAIPVATCTRHLYCRKVPPTYSRNVYEKMVKGDVSVHLDTLCRASIDAVEGAIRYCAFNIKVQGTLGLMQVI